MQEYADPVIDWLEAERKIFKARYYRQHCTIENGAYIKDLSVVERDLGKVCILDNSPISYAWHEGPLPPQACRLVASPPPCLLIAFPFSFVCYIPFVSYLHFPLLSFPNCGSMPSLPSLNGHKLITENAIPIEGWISDPTDNDLLHLIPFLRSLRFVGDVRNLLGLRTGARKA